LPATTARIHAVVVHHRGRDLLERCLLTLLASDGVDLRVAVVANACAEPLPAAAGDPRVAVLASSEPLGFAAANNRGAALLRERHGAPGALYFLNDDTESDAAALARLAAHLGRAARCGVAAPRLMIGGADGAVNSLGLNLTTTGEAWDEGIGRRLEELSPLPGVRPVLAASGTAVLVRREAFDAVGGWEELFHYYFEDVDLCLRVRDAGWEVEVVTGAVVVHALSATAGRDSGFKLYHTLRNRLLLLVLHWPAGLLARIAPRLVATELWRFGARLASGSPGEAWIQARAWAGFLAMLPRALRARRAASGAGLSHWLRPPAALPAIRLAPRAPGAADRRGAAA
jgi:N-acetylglucosaminyl-diphospho-decaprenol L-rhamnosyltransferase